MSSTQVDATSQGGPTVGDKVEWRAINPRPGQKKIASGKVVGFQGNDLLVEYEISLGRGQKKSKTIPVKRERLVDPS